MKDHIAIKSTRLAAGVILALGISGCGGPDLFGGNSSTGSGFNNGLGGNYGSGYGGNYGGSYGGNYGGGAGGARQAGGVKGRGTYPKIEASFELGDVKGNPFDF